MFKTINTEEKYQQEIIVWFRQMTRYIIPNGIYELESFNCLPFKYVMSPNCTLHTASSKSS